MSVWKGWQADFLTHTKGVPNTTHNRRFLTEWHDHAETNCRNNPIDLSAVFSFSKNCHALGGRNPQAQSYPTHPDAVAAFYTQVRDGNYPHLLHALASGNPYALDHDAVVALAGDLGEWGSGTFSSWYEDQQTQPVLTLKAPQALAGWKALRKSVNRGMPNALAHSHRVNKGTLRTLHRARKVRF